MLTTALECPHCHSAPGDACVTSGGKPVIDGNGTHAARHAAGRQAYAAEAKLSR